MNYTYKNYGIIVTAHLKGSFHIGHEKFEIKNLLLIGEDHSQAKLNDKENKDRQNYFFLQFRNYATTHSKNIMLLFEGIYNLNYSKTDKNAELTLLNPFLCTEFKDSNSVFYCKNSDYRLKFLRSLINKSYEYENPNCNCLGKIEPLKQLENIREHCTKNSIINLLNYSFINFNKRDNHNQLIRYLYDFLNKSTNINIEELKFIHKYIYVSFIFTHIQNIHVNDSDFKILEFMFNEEIVYMCKLWLFRFFFYLSSLNPSKLIDFMHEYLVSKLIKHTIIKDQKLLFEQLKMVSNIINFKMHFHLFFGNMNFYSLGKILNTFNMFFKLKTQKNYLLIASKTLNMKFKLILNNYNKKLYNDSDFDKFSFDEFLNYSLTFNNFENITNLNAQEKELLNLIINTLSLSTTSVLDKHFLIAKVFEISSSLIFLYDELQKKTMDIYDLFIHYLDSCVKLDFNKMVELVFYFFLTELPLFELYVVFNLIYYGNTKNIVVEGGYHHIDKIIRFLNSLSYKVNIVEKSVIDEQSIDDSINKFYNNIQ